MTSSSNGALTLHFVRHGETDFNAERRIQGQMTEVGLSTLGIEQAAAVAEELASCGAGALLASDLGRTMQTAAPIAQRLGLEIVPEPALREKHFGVLQGRLYSEVSEIVDGWWMRHDELFEDGETNRQMFERVAAFLDRLRSSPPSPNVVLVTHGGTINCALTYLDGIVIDAMEWRRIPNCSVHTVTL